MKTRSATIRADNVGSLLRPGYLRDAQERGVTGAELRALEDRAIAEAIALQEEVGLPVVTDGEYRRDSFFSTVIETIDGFDPHGHVRHFRDARGETLTRRTPTPVARLTRRALLADAELSFVQEHTSRPVKVTMPAPSLLGAYWTEGVSDKAYAGVDEFLEDLVALMNEDARELARRGVAYLQLDAPHYSYVADILPGVRDPLATLRRWVEIDQRVLDGVEGPVTGLHICRGNAAGRYVGTDPYDAFAGAILPAVSYDRVLLEYDDERAGGFETLSLARPEATVVLGLVTTKRSDMETADGLSARIEEASRHRPLERLALSTQCGFASIAVGNAISPEAQRAKLALVVEVAERVWGGA